MFPSYTSKPVLYFHELPPIRFDEVQIRVLFTSLCHSDLMTVRGKWGEVAELPFCPGHEVVGVITKIGTDVKSRKVGQKVGVSPLRGSCSKCESCTKAIDQYCDTREFLYHNGLKNFGGYSTHLQCMAKHAIPMPEDLDLSSAAPLLCAGLTVYSPLNTWKQPGIKVGVLGIGGLGHLAIQFASKMGMEVTAFTTSTGREKELKELGASYIRHSTDLLKLAEDEGKYHLVCDTLFVDDPVVYKAHQRLVRPGGTIIVVSAPDAAVKLELDMRYLMEKNIRVAGNVIGSSREVEEMLLFASNFGIKPVVETLPFERLPEAFEKMENGRPKFRMNIEVEPWAKANGFLK